MSDIAIFSDPWSIAFIYLIFGSPGFAIGAILGALVWRAHRIWGAIAGAAVGFVLCIAIVWLWLTA